MHPRYDVRIFRKMCISLSERNFSVSLVVADGLGAESKEGVMIIDVGSFDGRLSRMLNAPQKLFKQAIDLGCDLYHLHDPELIPLGLKLLNAGKKVIFDAHEDFPKQMMAKPYLNSFLRLALSFSFELTERFLFSQFSAVIGATPSISRKFSKFNDLSVNINNYPICDELDAGSSKRSFGRCVTYMGDISEIRGVEQLVQALSFTDEVRLNLAGEFISESFRSRIKGNSNIDKVNELGFLSRSDLRDVLSQSSAGIVTFLSSPNHLESQPNKMFEYMSSGIPVIASNFPLWREIIEGNDCGLCVNPEKPKEIAESIQFLVDNPSAGLKMGQKGIQAVRDKYNWSVEEKKLIRLYLRVLEAFQ